LAFGKAFKRVGNVTKIMKRDEYERLLLQRSKGKLQFDSQISEDATIKDIDETRVTPEGQPRL
jgi:predicted HTH transcriptional regulator